MDCRKCEILEEKVERQSDDLVSLEEAIVMGARCLGAELARNRVLQEENDELRLENAAEDFSPRCHKTACAGSATSGEKKEKEIVKELPPPTTPEPKVKTVLFGKPASGPVHDSVKPAPVLTDTNGINSELIVKTVCGFFNITDEQFYSKTKKGNLGDARKTATYLVRKMLKLDAHQTAAALKCAVGTVFGRSSEFNKDLKEPETVKRVELIESEIIKQKHNSKPRTSVRG